MTAQIDRHGGHYPADAKAAIADAARYQRADVTNPADIASEPVGWLTMRDA
ncbi:hypothetical protein ACFCX0_27165 [Streptomyces sp. NPDC056352]|uniref:hypothetical protein n=1 Tax=Streptomyces sp. NPDC056352 TaxID=3345791 RepID=UPI0035D8F3EF